MRSQFHALAIGAIGSFASSNCKPAQVSMEDNSALPTGTVYGKSLMNKIWPIVEQITESALHEQSEYFVNINQHAEKETFNFFIFPDGFSKFWRGTHFFESGVGLSFNSPNADKNIVDGMVKFGYRRNGDKKGSNPDCYAVEIYSIEVPHWQINFNSEHISFIKKKIEHEKHLNSDTLSRVCINSVDTGVGG